jgi:type VI secretion system protein ImpM
MPEFTLNAADFAPGFYGKLPSHGDFLSRRLPRQFIEPWDQWLQDSLAASREHLGKDWLNSFLVSPIWQFCLAPGLCGEDAWAGVMMPSVDKVGRYFPLTLATKVYDYQLPRLFAPDCGWFEALSELALSSLEYEFDLQTFDESLGSIRLSDFLLAQSTTASCQAILQKSSARLAFQFDLDSYQDTPQAFSDLSEKLSNHFLAHCSYWRSSATDNSKASLLLCEGLPPINAYVGFLNGGWPQRGWNFASSRVTCSAPANSIDGLARTSVVLGLDSSNDAGTMADTTVQQHDLPVNNISQIQSYGLSVVGLRRKINEDAILERVDAGLWAVADGMGGHSAGDVASQALVKALAQIPRIEDLEHYSEQVASCVHAVNRDLVQMGQSRGIGHIIGSTIVILLISGNQFRYLWAGDSRLYRYRNGTLEQLTLDHSLYNESISLGLGPHDGSIEDGRGNIITRAVGAELLLQLDCGHGEIVGQDLFILCSDGLDKELSHGDIAAFCNDDSVSDIAQALVREAEARGGRDNISVIVVKN